MTVVNTVTGEIIDFDRAAAERRAERITLRLEAIADNYAAVMPMIRESIEKQDHLALGYRSVGEYVADRFGGSLQRLGVEVRRAVVGELTAAGMSTRAIAPVVGVGKSTVDRDVSHMGHLNAGATYVAPGPTVSSAPIDGSAAEAVSDGEVTGPALAGTDDAPDAIQPERASADTHTQAPAPRTVTGIDGKTYTRPEPAAPRRSPLPDSFFRAVHEAQRKVESLHRLVEDDRWSQNAEKVAAAHRNDLLRINDLLQQVINSLPEQESSR